MHEFSLLKDLIRKIEQVARDHHVERVASVKVRIGALAHISGEHFRGHFEHAALGTSAEGARLDIEISTDETHPHAHDIMLVSVEVAEPA